MKKYFGIILLFCLTLTGCLGINKTRYDNPIPVTKVDLYTANYRVKRYVTAETTCRYIFGIGGLSRANLRTSAINELYMKAALRGSETLVNINTVIGVKVVLGIVIVRSCVASGYVIEFLPNGPSSAVSPIEEAPKAVETPKAEAVPAKPAKAAPKSSKTSAKASNKPVPAKETEVKEMPAGTSSNKEIAKEEVVAQPVIDEPKEQPVEEEKVLTPEERHNQIVKLYKEEKKTGNVVYKSYLDVYKNLSAKGGKTAMKNLPKVQDVAMDYLENPKQYRNLISELKQATSEAKKLKAFLKA